MYRSLEKKSIPSLTDEHQLSLEKSALRTVDATKRKQSIAGSNLAPPRVAIALTSNITKLKTDRIQNRAFDKSPWRCGI
jgi:hypothetical protein